MTTQTKFESQTCGRCGGTGHHSFNQVNGSTCFGCGGSGVTLTKRGSAARHFYLESLVKPVAAIAVGDFVFSSVTFGGRDVWCRVDAINAPDAAKWGSSNGIPFGTLELSRKGKKASHGYIAETTFRSVKNEAERVAKMDAALAYQATLGANGKPAKR